MQLIIRMLKLSFVVLVSLQLIGCEGDNAPITSNEITIVVNSINESDINGEGILEKDENISNHSGNPWGEFIKEVQSDFGRNPEQFEIVFVSVQFSNTENIVSFEDLISGKMAIRFLNTQGSDSDAIKVEIGSTMNPNGKSIIQLSNLASSSDLNILHERLIGGDFHVGFIGETNKLKEDNFSLDVIIRFAVKARIN